MKLRANINIRRCRDHPRDLFNLVPPHARFGIFQVRNSSVVIPAAKLLSLTINHVTKLSIPDLSTFSVGFLALFDQTFEFRGDPGSVVDV